MVNLGAQNLLEYTQLSIDIMEDKLSDATVTLGAM